MMKNIVYVKREFSCGVDELYQWLTQPQLIAQWFGPEQLKVNQVSNSIKVNGTYTIELEKPNAEIFFIEGVYLTLHHPTLIEFTLQYRNLKTTPPNSIVSIQLEMMSASKSRLLLKQTFELEPADMESRAKGWEHMLGVLNSLLSAST